jgi:hypothetical protein
MAQVVCPVGGYLAPELSAGSGVGVGAGGEGVAALRAQLLKMDPGMDLRASRRLVA